MAIARALDALWNKNLWLIRLFIAFLIGLPLALILYFCKNAWLRAFWIVFSLRYCRLVGHLISYHLLYSPSQEVLNPRFTPRDVTVILPTIDPNGPDFKECLESILAAKPAYVYVVTVGPDLLAECRTVLQAISPNYSQTTIIRLSALSEASKRKQITHAMPHIETAVVVLADDHVFWPSTNFLPSVLAPFNDHPGVGVVATKKRVRRTTPGKLSWMSLVNFVACNYLQRHNWELRANNAFDGGVFVVSGRTAVYRTDFLNDAGLLHRFCHEKFFFGLFGGGQGLGPDDDNFLTREAMKNGWLVRFQDTEDATVETTLGEWPKFNSQLLRWARTTFRSNPVMLRNPGFFLRYPWSFFMVYWVGIANFALWWDAAMMTCLLKGTDGSQRFYFEVFLLVCWIFFTKAVKILPSLVLHPADAKLLIFQVLFAYWHSIIKLRAMITFWDCDWSGRKLDNVGGEVGNNAEKPKGPIAFETI